MVFSSMTFLYYFLPVVLAIYFVAPRSLKNVVLLFASLFFYAWGEPKYLLLMGITIMIGYASAIFIEDKRDKMSGKIILGIALFCCLGLLGIFKYADFFVDSFNKATGMDVRLLNIALPVGISFYTFQLISYIVDVYRGDVRAQKNLILLGTYVVMFPQLIAGPIVRYQNIELDMVSRTHNIAKIREGIVRFVIGLGKKVLIANQLGELTEVYYRVGEGSVMLAWVCAVSSALQIYYDFSGYSDMAIGLGKILGFELPENFDYPYMSKSITEFWRRWHMTLGCWFRDYVYIPLGGSRVNSKRLVVNLLIVWLLTGLWHGASWNFVVWGLFFGMLLIIEKLWLLKYIQNAKGINHIYVILAVVISFVIFSTESISAAIDYIKTMFGLGGLSAVSQESIYYVASYGFTLFVALIGATPFVKYIAKKVMDGADKYKLDSVLESVVLAVILMLCTAHIVDGSFNPFLYFRF